MTELSDDQLKQVKGGGISLGVAALIALGIAFVAGVIDGYVRPFSCN